MRFLTEREKRQKLYKSRRWKNAARSFRAMHPLCARCQSVGILSPAECVDHIVPHKGDLQLFWDSSNWQTLCKACHKLKTDQEWRRTPKYDWQPRPGKYVVWGPPGCGKTTYVLQNAKAGDWVWDWDAVSRALDIPEPRDGGPNEEQMRTLLYERDKWIELASHAERAWFICTWKRTAHRVGHKLQAELISLPPRGFTWHGARIEMRDDLITAPPCMHTLST